jgi:superfamily I DNA and/or RNA helicase
MKLNKHITIDSVIIEKFNKNTNVSALIEKLLKEYTENNKPNSEKIKQKQAILKEKSKEIRNLKAEIKQIKQISILETQLNIQKEQNNKKSKHFEDTFLKWGATKEAKDLKVPSKLEYFRNNIYKGEK